MKWVIGRTVTLAAALGVAMAASAGTDQPRIIPERNILRALRQGFPDAAPADRQRLAPDATMAACAHWHDTPPKTVVDAIKVRERARIRFPEDGKFIGDWRNGERLAQSGYGLRFTDVPPVQPNGGNCYACHQLSAQEVSFGTIGVSLRGYGRIHEFRPESARAVYEKIYNSQAIVPCSLMPRFGANGILSIDQIKDLVALLMDPASPVNDPSRPSEAPSRPTPAAK